MIEALVADRSGIAQSDVDLVGDSERGEQIGPTRLPHLRCCQDCAEIVGWMARLTGRYIAVHEIKVPAESAIVERGAVRRGATASDERGQRTTAKFGDETANRRDRRRIQRCDGYTNRIQHANFELLQRPLAQILQSGTFHKRCELLYLFHDRRLLVLLRCRAPPMRASIPARSASGPHRRRPFSRLPAMQGQRNSMKTVATREQEPGWVTGLDYDGPPRLA